MTGAKWLYFPRPIVFLKVRHMMLGGSSPRYRARKACAATSCRPLRQARSADLPKAKESAQWPSGSSAGDEVLAAILARDTQALALNTRRGHLDPQDRRVLTASRISSERRGGDLTAAEAVRRHARSRRPPGGYTRIARSATTASRRGSLVRLQLSPKSPPRAARRVAAPDFVASATSAATSSRRRR